MQTIYNVYFHGCYLFENKKNEINLICSNEIVLNLDMFVILTFISIFYNFAQFKKNIYLPCRNHSICLDWMSETFFLFVKW